LLKYKLHCGTFRLFYSICLTNAQDQSFYLSTDAQESCFKRILKSSVGK